MKSNEEINNKEQIEEVILDNSNQVQEEVKKEEATLDNKNKSIEEIIKEEKDKLYLAKTISSLQTENEELKKQFDNFKKEIEELKKNKNFYNESKITNEQTTNIQFDPKDDWWTFSKKIKGEI